MFTVQVFKLITRKGYRLLILCFVVLVIVYLVNRSLKVKTANQLESVSELVPNTVHFIIFNSTKLDFTSYLSVTSVLKIHRPNIVIVHCDCKNLEGNYWTLLLELSQSLSVPLLVSYLPRPTHVFGQSLSSVYHATDIARIQVLMRYGGIYLDTDVLVLKRLNEFLKYEMVVGWPKNEYIGTQVLIARKNARFLKLWLDGYQRYRPRAWYYNAGQYPTEQILEKHPELIHRVPVLFGVNNLLDKLYTNSKWPEWREYYAIHLLSRHEPAPKGLNETTIKSYTKPFGEIARWLLYELPPYFIDIEDFQFYASSNFPPDYIQ